MAVIGVGETKYSLSRSREGEREYEVTWKIRTDDKDDGPQVIMDSGFLSPIGASWNFGNDSDIWCYCTADLRIRKLQSDDESTFFWTATQLFSNAAIDRCQDQSVDDPLLEPDRIGGGTVKYTKEVTHDRNGDAILTSARELIKGPLVEFDAHKFTVWVEQNVSDLELDVFADMTNKVNENTMWGLGVRQVKLSNATWERKHYGLCNVYYVRTFEFDVDVDTFDRIGLDEGTKVLKGDWEYDANNDLVLPKNWILDAGINPGNQAHLDNPNNYEVYLDSKGNPTSVILDGAGQPWEGTYDPGTVTIEYYKEADFFTLGIPTSF